MAVGSCRQLHICGWRVVLKHPCAGHSHLPHIIPQKHGCAPFTDGVDLSMPSLHLPPEPALLELPVTQLPRPTDLAQTDQTSLDVPCVPQCPIGSVSKLRLSLAFTLESPGGWDQADLAHDSNLVPSTAPGT